MPSSPKASVIRLGRQQTAQSSVKVWRRPPLGSTKTSLSSPQNAQLYVTILILHAIMSCEEALPGCPCHYRLKAANCAYGYR